MNTCPVCGFGMRYPAENYNICPCCGTEFGLDDAYTSRDELRVHWLREGAKWWSPVELPPQNWDPFRQLNSLISHSPRRVILQSFGWAHEPSIALAKLIAGRVHSGQEAREFAPLTPSGARGGVLLEPQRTATGRLGREQTEPSSLLQKALSGPEQSAPTLAC